MEEVLIGAAPFGEQEIEKEKKHDPTDNTLENVMTTESKIHKQVNAQIGQIGTWEEQCNL